jgi:transcriptional regulator with XRE-family HTH domain
MATIEQREAFKQAVIHTREGHGWSQRKLAELLGVAHSTVAFWEQGKSLPNPANVVDLERALKLEAGTLARLLGYMPMETMRREMASVLDAIMADPELGQRERDLLLAMYRELVRQRRADQKTGQADAGDLEDDDR